MERLHDAGATNERARQDSGFTIVELMISISILAVLTLATLLTIIPISRQNRINRETEIAMAEVRNQLERIHSTPFNELPDVFPTGTSINIAGVSNGTVVVDYLDPTADPVVMRLDLSWDLQDGGTIQRSFFTVRTE